MHSTSGSGAPQAWTLMNRAASRSRLVNDKARVLHEVRFGAGEARVASLQQGAAAGAMQVKLLNMDRDTTLPICLACS